MVTTVTGTLAIGQTLIILTAGVDLGNAAIMVAGTVVVGKLATQGHVGWGMLAGLLVCVVLSGLGGLVVARLKLPPFIVTLGMFSAVTAGAQLFTDNQTYPVDSGVLTWLGNGPQVGGATITYGTILWVVLTAVTGYCLTRTAWGVRVYAVGNSESASRLNGVKVSRVLFSVYAVAGVLYALAAWQALGRTPVADPTAYASSNLDSITAVVIGGTSLFGGRGGVAGTLLGSLIVTVLQNGLTQAGIDSLYQQVATGVLVVVAVLVDFIIRKGRE